MVWKGEVFINDEAKASAVYTAPYFWKGIIVPVLYVRYAYASTCGLKRRNAWKSVGFTDDARKRCKSFRLKDVGSANSELAPRWFIRPASLRGAAPSCS